MIDNTPYIIVDNQKISPIGRSPRPDSADVDTDRRQGPVFGVVDRVTLSREGREKSKWQQTHAEAPQPVLENLPKQLTDNDPSRLTDSPKKRR